MQIAINITHEFNDVTAFAEFAGKLKALFSEFKVSVGGTPAPTDLKTPPALLEKIEAAVRSADPVEVSAAVPTEAKREAPAEAIVPPASVPSVPADVAPRAKRGRRSNAEIAAEKAAKETATNPPGPLPASGSFGGPATTAAPMPPAGSPVPSPAGGDLRATRAYVLEWIGRNGDADYMKILSKYQDPAAGKVRLTDMDPATIDKIVSELRASDKTN